MALKTKCLSLFALFPFFALFAPRAAHAETDPRDYEALVALPSNTTVVAGYYRHVSSADKLSYSQDVALFRGAYILRFGNLAIAPVDVALPVADVVFYAPAQSHASGLGDFLFFPTIGYLFQEDEINHTYVAFTPYVSFPTGQYDPTHAPINVGNHRYYFEQELAVGQRFMKVVNLELVANATEYTDNSSFDVTTPAGTIQGTLHQKPTLGAVFHASVDVSPNIYFAGSLYVTANGQTNFLYAPASIDSIAVPQQTVETARFGMGIRVEPRTLLLLQYNQDLGQSNEWSVSRFVGARISHVF